MRILLILICGVLITGCGVSKSSFSPAKKYSPEKLQKDYSIYQQILEEAHPGLYWYQSKDSMDYYFNWGREQLKDSLTETGFRKVLAYVTAKINCGHTSVRASKFYSRFIDTARISRMFPLSLKLWDDTAVVAANLDRRDSLLKRGTMINKINGWPIDRIADTLFNYISTDGYNATHKYQSLSNRGYFGSLYTSLFGFSPNYNIEYTDSTGRIKKTTIKTYRPVSDTEDSSDIRAIRTVPHPSLK
jgi:hypothetical protein